MEETKKCKYCQSDIPKKAKVCPNCKKKQGGGIFKWIIIVVAVLLVAIAVTSGGNDNNTTNTSSSNSNTISDTQEQEIEYIAVDVSKMMEDLSGNAMSASDTYKDQYLEITGYLAVIDSDGKYISLVADQYSIIGVTCYIKTDEQKEAVKKMSVGDTITLKGECTDVGEVLGYYVNIDSISE